MENASKNAEEMIEKLQMQFNRMRQATITNELVDIITGASGASFLLAFFSFLFFLGLVMKLTRILIDSSY